MSAPATTELEVTGMTCNNCARHVTDAAQQVPGVRSVSVSLQSAHASVRWNPDATENAGAVIKAITQAGYAASELSDTGHSHESRWQWNLVVGLGVTSALMLCEWVFGVSMKPWFQWLAFTLAAVVQVFCGVEFYAGAWRQLKVGQSNMDTLVALGSTTAFGYSAWALLTGAGGHLYFMEAAAIISLVSFGHWIEARVSERASGALKSLLNLAPQTARRLSAVHEFPSKDSKDHAVDISGNKWFDARPHPGPLPRGEGEPVAVFWRNAGTESKSVQGKAGLKSFTFPQSAIANPQSTIETEVPVADLKINDRVALRPGDRVPVDGVVLEGESAVDEAMLTGESVPADKKTGSELFAGTVNLNGRLVMRVTATGEETALAHIVASVQRAQTSRADIQRLGDRISNVFVPVIIVIAVGAGLWWGLAPQSAGHVHDLLARIFWHAHAPAGVAAGFIIAAAVLIIACPCAMGLATPAAIMAAANTAARRGILIRDGVALEKAGTITAVVFDKTGTLTRGKPQVAEIWQNSADVQTAWHLALALAQNSTHPVSQAVSSYCASTAVNQAPENVSIDQWQEIRGSGVEAKSTLGNRQPAIVRLGSLHWLRESGIDLTPGQKFAAGWSAQGATIVGLAAETELLALFAVRDTVKQNAAKIVAQLHQQGLKTYLLTGDNAQTAAAIAKQVGIAVENVFAEVRPEEKAEFVRKLQAGSGTGVSPVRSATKTHRRNACATRVAFVGDGINDAPALMQADLGIAVSRASDVAREAADIILLKSEIEAVPEALGLAKATLRVIKQNLFWAFFYNALGVPLAALGFISPIFCAAAMGVSDLVVIGNALRLLRWKSEK